MFSLVDSCLKEGQDFASFHNQLQDFFKLLIAHNVSKEAWVTYHILNQGKQLKFPDCYLRASGEASQELQRLVQENEYFKSELESVRASERRTKAELIEAKLVLKHSESEAMQLLQQSNVELQQCNKKLKEESERADLHEWRAEQALHRFRTEQGVNEDLRAEIAKQLQVTTTLEQNGSENLQKATRKIIHVEEDLLSAQREIKMLQESEAILMKRLSVLQTLKLNDVSAEETARQVLTPFKITRAHAVIAQGMVRRNFVFEAKQRPDRRRQTLYDKKEEIRELKKQECNKHPIHSLCHSLAVQVHPPAREVRQGLHGREKRSTTRSHSAPFFGAQPSCAVQHDTAAERFSVRHGGGERDYGKHDHGKCPRLGLSAPLGRVMEERVD
eukprot:763395-Hanusia_phi.AAC.6